MSTATELEKFKQKAKRLPLQDRATLISHLIDSLDSLDENECERLWLQEASRRFQQYQDGKISSRPTDEVFLSAHAKLNDFR